MASDDVQTNLRLPADLKERLTASAAENNRSLSAEVTSRLEASYSGPIPSTIVGGISALAEALESAKINVLIEQALAYQFAEALKFVLDTGRVPDDFHVRKGPGVRSLSEVVSDTIRDYEGALRAARVAADAQKERLQKLLSEIPGQDS